MDREMLKAHGTAHTSTSETTEMNHFGMTTLLFATEFSLHYSLYDIKNWGFEVAQFL